MAEKNIRTIIADSPLSSAGKSAITTWVKYRMADGETFNANKLNILLTTAAAAENEHGVIALCGVIDSCIRSKSRKIFWDRLDEQHCPKTQAEAEAQGSIERRCTREMYERTKEIFRLQFGQEALDEIVAKYNLS